MFWGWALSEEPRIRPWASSEPVERIRCREGARLGGADAGAEHQQHAGHGEPPGAKQCTQRVLLVVFVIDGDQ